MRIGEGFFVCAPDDAHTPGRLEGAGALLVVGALVGAVVALVVHLNHEVEGRQEVVHEVADTVHPAGELRAVGHPKGSDRVLKGQLGVRAPVQPAPAGRHDVHQMLSRNSTRCARVSKNVSWLKLITTEVSTPITPREVRNADPLAPGAAGFVTMFPPANTPR